MSDAIARFRDMALAIRCRSDAAFVAPDHLYLGPVFSLRNVTSRLIAGKVSAKDFASMLRQAARTAPGVKGTPDAAEALSTNREAMNKWFAHYRRPILATAPSKTDFNKQHAAALREAVRWGELLPSIEKRLDAVSEATLAMREMAADAWLSRYSRTKQRYAKTLLRWQRDFDALARFIESPPATSSSPTSEKQTRGRKKKGGKGPGGRPETRPLDFYADAVEWCEREQKKARKAKQRRKTIAQLLSDYFTNEKKMSLLDAVPLQRDREPWDERARRFWDTAKQRIKRAN